MNLIAILELINILFAGMLAGMEFVIHYSITVPALVLDDLSQLKYRKAFVLRLRVLVPAFFIPVALSGIAITFLNGFDSGFWFRCAGLLGILIWVLLRVVGTVPINSATVDWPIDNPPKDWKERINNAERFHIVGVWAAILMFACFLIAVALKLGSF